MADPDLYADEELDSPHASAHHDAGFGSAASFETQASVVRAATKNFVIPADAQLLVNR